MQAELTYKIREFEKKSLLPYTDERNILMLPSIYAIQFEKTALHEKAYPAAYKKENELKMAFLSKQIF